MVKRINQERKTNIDIKFWAPCKAPINVNSLLKGALQGAPKLYVYVRFSFSNQGERVLEESYPEARGGLAVNALGAVGHYDLAV